MEASTAAAPAAISAAIRAGPCGALDLQLEAGFACVGDSQHDCRLTVELRPHVSVLGQRASGTDGGTIAEPSQPCQRPPVRQRRRP